MTGTTPPYEPTASTPDLAPGPDSGSGSGSASGGTLALPPLVRAAVELERHVAGRGWDRPPAVFALVPTAVLAQAAPELGVAPDADPDDLSAVEQEDLDADDLEELLGRLAWPAVVTGAALVVERLAVPPTAPTSADGTPGDGTPAVLDQDDEDAARALLDHPDRVELRLVVAVTRDGDSVCLVRRRDADDDDSVAIARDLGSGLVAALTATFDDTDGDDVTDAQG